jgi:hypothetical protein
VSKCTAFNRHFNFDICIREYFPTQKRYLENISIIMRGWKRWFSPIPPIEELLDFTLFLYILE